MTNTKPVIFLDVDGVINDLRWSDENLQDVYPTELGYDVRVSLQTIELVQHLNEIADIYWLTTWRENANRDISPILGIPTDLPVITDDTDNRNVAWKAAEARKVAAGLLDEGRRVYWIEDFYGRLPFVPGVRMVDTGAQERLTYEVLPYKLLPV